MGDPHSLSDEEFREKYPALWRRQQRLKKAKKQPPPKPSRIDKATATRKSNHQAIPRHGFRWIPDEDRYLRNHWGLFSLNVMEKDLMRGARAIYERAQTLDLKVAREDMSLAAFAKYSGFDRSKVRNAAEVLGVKLRRGKRARKWEPSPKRKAARSAKSNRWFVPSEFQDELLAFLLEHSENRIQVRRGRWGVGRLPRACTGCQSRESAHYGRGYCKRCYDRFARPKTSTG